MGKRVKEYGLIERNVDKAKKSKLGTYVYLLFVFAVAAVLSMSYATQKITLLYGYNKALGQPFTSAFNTYWYAPWSVLSWYLSGVKLGAKEVDDIVSNAFLIFIALEAASILLFVLATGNKKMKGIKDLHGSARWAVKAEIKSMSLMEGEGVYVGGWVERVKSKEVQHYLRHDGPEHILCFAPTRSGKGVGLILPTLLAWEHSSIVLDIKGENWALTAGWRKAQGHKVLRFDPTDETGNSAAFNPLEELPINTLRAIPAVQKFALMLVDPEGKGLVDHWSKAAFAFFSGVVLHCCVKTLHEKERFANLRDLILIMADETRDTQGLLEEMLEMDHEGILKEKFKDCSGAEYAHTFIASSAREMMNKAENEASGVLSSAAVNLSLYQDPVVALNTSKSDFKIDDLMNFENPVDLFFVISSSEGDRMQPLIRLMVSMIIRHICAKMEFADGASVAGYKHRILLMLDEFTSLGRIPLLEKAIAYIAGFGGKLFIIVQDTVQLNEAYGEKNAIMANCHIRIAYAPNNYPTAQLISDMAGKATVVEEKKSITRSKGGKSVSINITETARPLLTPDECMRLPGIQKDDDGNLIPGDMLIFVAGNNTIYGRQILYFRDPIFSQRAKIPAPVVTDSLYFPREEPKEVEEKAEILAPKEEEKFNYEEYLQ